MLYFTEELWWGAALLARQSITQMGNNYFHFQKTTHTVQPQSKINELSWWALGQWRYTPQLQQYSDCQFVGQTREEFSLSECTQRFARRLSISFSRCGLLPS